MADYEKAGLLVVRDGRILLCRKRSGTSLLILPGGKYEAGEDAAACLARELAEELGDVRTGPLEYVGTYTEVAAGSESGSPKTVSIDLYRGELAGNPDATSEIRELVWFSESDDRAELAPSLRNKILPDLVCRGMLPWRRS